MQLNREDISLKAKPFVVLACHEAAVDTLRLESRMDCHDVTRVIRGRKCLTKQGFFNEVAAALQFPYYFGENWDAFSECMNDLKDWLPASRYLLVIKDADQLLLHESTDQFDMLIRVLGRSAKNWRSGFNGKRYSLAPVRDSQSENETEFVVAFQYAVRSIQDGNFKSWLKESGVAVISDEVK